MNVKNDVHLKHLVVKGGYNLLYIELASIFIPILRLNLRHFICVHNHPSDDVKPSEEDIVQCKEVGKASKLLKMSFLDNLIVSKTGFYSFKKEGLL